MVLCVRACEVVGCMGILSIVTEEDVMLAVDALSPKYGTCKHVETSHTGGIARATVAGCESE